MITKRILCGHIGILPDGQIQVRQDTVLEEDGIELSRTYHRHVIEPGQNIAQEDPRVKAICAVLWTPSVIAQYQQDKVARQLERII